MTGFGMALAEVSGRVHKASERRRLGADTPRDGPDTEFREYERNAAMNQTTKTIAVFAQPFSVPGFDETLPAGAYEIETEHFAPPDVLDPDAWKASVMVKLHTRQSHPGLARILTVSLIDLDRARARDKVTGKKLTDLFLEEMLGDPLVLLVMEADGVSEAQLRHLYSGSRTPRTGDDATGLKTATMTRRDEASIRAAENEGMPVKT